MKQATLQALVAALACVTSVQAQVNSGSDGHDGAFNPTTDTVINMADHPDGIYHYTQLNIPPGITVSFIPNAGNTPVVWLVQGSVTINGAISLSGGPGVLSGIGGVGGPGGFRGGNPGGISSTPGAGVGPGGGKADSLKGVGGNASYGTPGGVFTSSQADAGETYGNSFLVPLIGGSGGGGNNRCSGGGGGGALLIAANETILLNGTISSTGGNNDGYFPTSGGGSGGAVRLVGTRIRGGGSIRVEGGPAWLSDASTVTYAGMGRIRFDSLDNTFTGYSSGIANRGYQPIIIPPVSQAVSLAIQSVAGVAVPQNPTGGSLTPDVVLPGAQQNPVSIAVRCLNIPLNTDIIIDVKPANGATIRAVGVNNTGTQASSTATVSVNLPRGAGTVQAKCVSGIAGSLGASLNNGEKFKNYAKTGLTADGEVFAQMEITATLGRGQEIAYITESGKRFVLPRN